MDNLREKHWHHHPLSELDALLESHNQNGLDELTVKERQLLYGSNRLTPQKGKNPFVMFMLQFHQPLVYILLAASIVTFILQEYVDSGVIFAVILVNAIVGFIQEMKALRAVEALAKSMEGKSTVIRDGHKLVIPSDEIVIGDLVILQSGDRVPADLRLIRNRELQVDESALTGESVPSQKNLTPLPIDTTLADRDNMVYSSTLVTYGTASGFVVEIGDNTEIGRINTLIANTQVLATPLTIKISEFSELLLKIILGLAALTFAIGWLHGQPMLDTFMSAVALAVGAIPEGLPAAISIMLAIGVNKMAQRNAIIRKMPAVETLGSTTIICSDKTGTLTQNQMTVQHVFASYQDYSVSGTGYTPQGELLFNDEALSLNTDTNQNVISQNNVALAETLKAGLLCNDSRLFQQQSQWKIEGDPTEAALISSALKAGFNIEQQDKLLPRIDTLPFESQHQYMATLHQSSQSDSYIYIKGSVESILKRCGNALAADGGSIPLDVPRIFEEIEQMASRGLRVLAFARKLVTQDSKSVTHESINTDLTFLGLQAMMDPPREEAIQAVKACQNAGILVKMITGDHVATAASIARQIGLKEPSHDSTHNYAYSGHDLAQLNNQELMEVAQSSAVFARVTPEQKLRLVEALQAKGHIVAMTGDGVNDAPALKQANIGIAMGLGGTEVAKEAADMVLTNDNFATIEAAVEEGRSVFDNLVKFITWTLPTNAGEGLVIMTAILFGLTLPITPVQILWINMSTALLLGLMLAFEQKEPGLMNRPPRKPGAPIINFELMIRVLSVSSLMLIGAYALFAWAIAEGHSTETARTLAVNMFVFGEIFYLFNCRSLRYSMFKIGFFSNPWLLFGVVLMASLQLAFTYSPTMNTLFGSAPLSALQWLAVMAGGAVIFIVVELEKRYRAYQETQRK
ncbi:cation-transporting P-type ATPase [Thiomicrorhabdus lithotrophica]|uniref:Cation-transporting P-type ATPase n=1 Tax=Thiomicrorhabdus lithotrophica TaxID=2949997 RepID=A0ABY8C906_9GAMM|nr:cation-transporting P-type ATPase [Thiomicrorhabdus lithotrophica]WEJ62404.1 cation-transporting P-type ATPase [Thiomicrorhabdus lithotrophica]